jgi:hypothetical protein
MIPPTSRPELLDLMQWVTLIPSHQMTLFGPRFTIYTRRCKGSPLGTFWACWGNGGAIISVS